MTTTLPAGSHLNYNNSKLGIYGELGEGANAKVRFLETVITREDLDSITLISNIPGSETWEVRDLFQRDVDDERVTNQILPYLKNPALVKYFNPITLILLPMSDDGREIIKYVENIIPTKGSNGIREVFEKSNYYKLSIFEHEDPIGKIEWNDRKCHLVAIDGQHRISALQRWKSEPSGDFNDWKIPVVILNIFKVNPALTTAGLLEIVRKTFVYINTKSERINKAREILLNDESVNALCTQELIQYAHENDIKPISARNARIIPLIFFDWQGKVSNNVHIEGPASVKSIEEIRDWFREYLLDEDGEDYQESELELIDLVPPLQSYGVNVALTHEDTIRIRHQFRNVMLPGILFFLENFTPYRDYIASCRRIEKESIERSDNAQHAFMKLRFGSHNAPPDQISAVQAEYENIKDRFGDLKNTFPFLLQKDLGMRGVMYAFGTCKYELYGILEETLSYLEYSKLFTEKINEIFEEDWFQHLAHLSAVKRSFLTNLVYDEAGTIINYKLSQAKDGLGALLVVLVFKKLNNTEQITEDDFESIWGDYSNVIRKTYERGLRRYHKSVLQATWEGSIADFNAEVKRLAEIDSSARVDELYQFLMDNE